jgi:hypothetical protein
MYTTFEEFKKIPDGRVFRVITTDFHHERIDGAITFACKKGYGYNDWRIYYGPASWSVGTILSEGEKLVNEEKIRSLFPCDDEIFSRYRY